MRKAFSLAIIATILAIMAYLTKPSDETCIAKAIKEYKETKFPMVSTPQKINTRLLTETLQKNFISSLVIEDRLLYKEIYQVKGSKTRIGWGVFGWVTVDLK